MNKGFNTLLKETKERLVKDVNDAFQSGLPVGAVHLIFENIMYEINDSYKATLLKEASSSNGADLKEEDEINDMAD